MPITWKSNKARAWGDDLDEDSGARAPPAGEEEKALPERTVVGPDEKGVKTITEYSRNDKGEAVKTVRRVRIVKRIRKVSKKVKERRDNWQRFGQFYADGVANDSRDEETTTFVSKEDIMIESKEDQERAERENDQYGDQLVNKLQEAYRKRRMQEKLSEQGLTLDEDGNVVNTATGAGSGGGLRRGTAQSRAIAEGKDPNGGAGTKGKYVPPSQRAGGSKYSAKGADDRPNEEVSNSLRVTNITEDATEQDLKELFRPFGHVTRIYLAKDRETQASRGFAYVSYISHEEAKKAKMALDGYGYGYLILKVDWAKPSNRDDVGSQNVMKYASGYGGALPQG